MPKFQVGEEVMYHDQPAVITEVHQYLPTRTGRKRLLWYSVRYVGFTAQYAVAQKTNSIKKIRGGKK